MHSLRSILGSQALPFQSGGLFGRGSFVHCSNIGSYHQIASFPEQNDPECMRGAPTPQLSNGTGDETLRRLATPVVPARFSRPRISSRMVRDKSGVLPHYGNAKTELPTLPKMRQPTPLHYQHARSERRTHLVHLPITLFAATIGVWLFYVQHQFEQTAWERDEHWNLHQAALHGSSHYDLPVVLRWPLWRRATTCQPNIGRCFWTTREPTSAMTTCCRV